jgi:hypothetical protein
MLSVEELRTIIAYDTDTGHFTWLKKISRKVVPGRRAGVMGGGRRRYISILGRMFHEHRLAVLLMTGALPNGDVDHINGDPSDNRWCNLRVASRTENLANQKRRKDSRSGLKGVHWSSCHGKWVAGIRCRGKKHHLGVFTDPAEGHKAYMAAAKRLFGEFACNGER